ncbi:hypothetical protein NITHO_280025 [Nitrolancea hollandica Lb]|uniref:Uncharacterized protein n=1 Tax=Nitrolancea hollandica Lb TaxID=1129897 RepID=I4EGS0_9BACT|nr:hypothetical protein NITHO_280025 [Nitrolancea hollandica Lb]
MPRASRQGCVPAVPGTNQERGRRGDSTTLALKLGAVGRDRIVAPCLPDSARLPAVAQQGLACSQR